MNTSHTDPKDLLALVRQSRTLMVGGAHDGMSAYLVDAAGFDAVWVSGFCVSSAKLIPDENILSITEMSDRVAEIVEATRLPVIVDCDEGYGALTSSLRLARKLVGAGASGLCIEDNLFPKKNSFLGTEAEQELMPVDGFCEKLAAIKNVLGKRALIARTESLIRGEGTEMAYARAARYVEAGADMIVIHSRFRHIEDFIRLKEGWRCDAPLVVIPTKCEDAHFDQFRNAGYAMVIYANHAFRSAVRAMHATLQKIRMSGRIAPVADELVSMDYLFDLTKAR